MAGATVLGSTAVHRSRSITFLYEQPVNVNLLPVTWPQARKEEAEKVGRSFFIEQVPERGETPKRREF